MKTFSKNAMVTVLAVSFVFVMFGFTGPIPAFAATTPSLGAAATYAILSSTYTNTTAGTTITGDIGFTTGPAVAPLGVHTNYGSGAPYATAGIDQGTALAALSPQACTFTFAAGAINLSTDTTHGPIGVYTPGVYCSTGAMNVGGPLNLNGSGTYIFRAVGALTSTVGAVVTLLGGASAGDVFWTPTQATTLAANTVFVGTVIDDAGITVGANSNWIGRALAFGGTVKTDTDTIATPTSAATLHVIKQVINDSGGIAIASNFSVHVRHTGSDVLGSPTVGTITPGTTYLLAAGTYAVDENTNSYYTKTFSGDCDISGNITLAAGDNKTCTITNDDIGVVPSTLRVIKHVINDNSGTAIASNFTVHVKLLGADVLGSPEAGLESPGTTFLLPVGTYVVSENPNALYTQTFSGDCDSSGNVTLAAGNNKTCTITNDDIPPATSSPTDNTITVIKHVINDNGRTATYTDFPLFINGNPVTSGESIRFAPGIYTVTETGSTNYTTTFSGDCDAAGRINHGGLNTHNDICIVTNNDIGTPVVVPPVPPLIDVVKVPSPLALPAGPGSVTYTYTLRNIGTVPVTNVTMIGDTCSPIILSSGDTNGDAKLDVNETWIHTCTTTLSATHTNTVVATGRANGLSATDIASATVVVGEPIVPPLIHVTKVPSPLTLLAGGGMVTYTKRVTNPGTVALSNIGITDDECGPVAYVSGDTNGDAKLDITETWVYTCRTNLTATTVNTATASGEANGLVARDFAIATVVVAAAVAPVPALPNTGFSPEGKNSPLDIIVLSGIFMLATISFAVVIKKSTI